MARIGNNAPKPTRAQSKERGLAVYKMLLDGKSRPEIIAFCKKSWAIRRSAADDLIQLGGKWIEEDIAAVRPAKLASILKKQIALYDTILEDRPMSKEGSGLPNYGAARQVLMDHAKLLGYDKQKVEITTPGRDEEFSLMSAEDLEVELGSDEGT